MDAAQPFGYQPPPVGAPIMPGRSPMGMPPQAGMVRSSDQMEGAGDEAPPAKRQKIARLPNGGYYPEADWINMHPVGISCLVKAQPDADWHASSTPST